MTETNHSNWESHKWELIDKVVVDIYNFPYYKYYYKCSNCGIWGIYNESLHEGHMMEINLNCDEVIIRDIIE
jgi:hypothetical protein